MSERELELRDLVLAVLFGSLFGLLLGIATG